MQDAKSMYECYNCGSKDVVLSMNSKGDKAECLACNHTVHSEFTDQKPPTPAATTVDSESNAPTFRMGALSDIVRESLAPRIIQVELPREAGGCDPDITSGSTARNSVPLETSAFPPASVSSTAVSGSTPSGYSICLEPTVYPSLTAAKFTAFVKHKDRVIGEQEAKELAELIGRLHAKANAKPIQVDTPVDPWSGRKWVGFRFRGPTNEEVIAAFAKALEPAKNVDIKFAVNPDELGFVRGVACMNKAEHDRAYAYLNIKGIDLSGFYFV